MGTGSGVGDLTMYTDSVLLGYWGMITETGWYNAALKLNRLVLFPMALVSSALFPALIGVLKESNERFVRYWTFWMKGTVFFSVLLFFLVLAKADKIIALLYSEDFLPSVTVLKILIFMATLVYIHNLYHHILLIFNQQKRIFYAMACGAAMNVILNLLLIPRFGINGAALATVCSHITILCLYIAWTTKYTFIKSARKPRAFKLGEEWPPGAKPALAGVAEAISP